MDRSSHDRRDFVEIAHKVIGGLIPQGSTVALFDFPKHANVGDSAIWLGEIHYLQRKISKELLVVDIFPALAREVPALSRDTIILIHGGGNFGDLYPRHQTLRELVISRYPENRIIQLPQSIYFQSSQAEARCSTVLNSHNDFHLLVRDRRSLRSARRLYSGPCYLCPDMALCLGLLRRPTTPVHSILGLLRTDNEGIALAAPSAKESEEFVNVDWLAESVTLTRRLDDGLDRLQALFPRRLSPVYQSTLFYRFRHRVYDRLARERMRRGCELLASGRVVITDRLHAHILCTLLDIPHVVLDNHYHKIRNFRATWNTGGEVCESASNFSEALQKATRLVTLSPICRRGD